MKAFLRRAYTESQALAMINFPGKITKSSKSCTDLKNVLQLRGVLSVGKRRLDKV